MLLAIVLQAGLLSGLVGILVYVLVAVIIIWAIYLVLGILKLPEPINQIVYLIVALVVIIWLLNHFVGITL